MWTLQDLSTNLQAVQSLVFIILVLGGN